MKVTKVIHRSFLVFTNKLRTNFYSKLLLSIICFSLIPTLLLILIVCCIYSTKYNYELERYSMTSLQLVRSNIRTYLDKALGEALVIAKMQSINNAILNRKIDELQMLTFELKSAINADLLIITDDNGKVITQAKDVQKYLRLILSEKNFSKIIIENKFNKEIIENDDEVLLVATVPVFNWVANGTITVGYRLNKERLSLVKDFLGLDIILLHKDGSHKHTYSNSNSGIQKVIKLLISMRGINENRTRFFREKVNNELQQFIVAPLSESSKKTIIAVSSPIRSWYIEFLQFQYTFIVLIIVLIISLIFSAYKWGRKITKPLYAILDIAKQENELDSCFKEDDLYTLDEFEKIGYAFKRMAKKIKQQSRLAAIGSTTAILAHDVRKPFTKLKALLNYFDEYKQSPVKLENAKQEIEKSIKQVESMINDIMDFSREVKLETKPVPLVQLFDFSIRQITQGHDESLIMFEYNVSHSKKPRVDDERMSRVFSNIIGNGIEAITVIGKKNTGTITITTKDIQREDTSFIEITIANDGPLFKEEDIPNLFESFFTKGKRKGTGLGLASAQKIINLHGGTITAHNKSHDTGVEFVMTVPASDEKERIDLTILPKNSKEAAFIELKKDTRELDRIIETIQNKRFKILLLEDEALYRSAVKSMIQKDETLRNIITLYDAHTVDEALEIVEKENISHAIVDIDLGDVQNGFDFLVYLSQNLKTKNQKLSCMIHSNRHLDEFRQKAFSLGAKAFVPKPLALEHLVDFLSVSGLPCVAPDLHSSPSEVGLAKQADGSEVSVVEETRKPLTENHKPRILVIDDDPILLKVTGDIVGRTFYGATVLEAKSPEQAMDMLHDQQFDYILCDINFDNSPMNGYEFVHTLRKDTPGSKIYLVSSTPTELAYDEAMRAGADGYIEQPISKEKIRTLSSIFPYALRTTEIEKARAPKTQNLKPNLLLCRVFHDMKKLHLFMDSFIRESQGENLNEWKELLKLYGDYSLRVTNLFREYLRKREVIIDDEALMKKLNAEAKALKEGLEHVMLRANTEGTYEASEFTHC